MVPISERCPVESSFPGRPPRRCILRADHGGRCIPCWRCGGLGFRRQPCQVCALWRAADGTLTYVAGSIWGDQEPPARPKEKRRKVWG